MVFAREVLPAYGAKDTSTYATIVGKGLLAEPSVKLSASGRPDIVAASVVAKSNVLLTCSFNLAGALEGFYDLYLDMSGSTAVMPRAFHVLAKNTMPLVWSTLDMGAMPIAPVVTGLESGVAVADVNHDGQQEVYATNRNAYFFKFTGAASSWTCQSVATSTGENYNDILAADIDGDGVKELYLAGQDTSGGANNHVRQFKYNGTSFAQTADLGSVSSRFLCLATGDGDNDGDLELYAGTSDGHVHAFEYNGTWTRNDCGQAAGTAIRSLAVADGNGDSKFEVYAGGADHAIYQYVYSAGWTHAGIVTLPGMVYGLAASDQDRDINHFLELYAACEDGKLYQVKKIDASNWGTSEVAGASGAMQKVIAADGDSTGQERLYAANSDGHVYQVYLEGGAWMKNDCGAIGQSVYGLAAGDADNDHQHELYAAAANNRLFLVKPASLNPTPTATPSPCLSATITPPSMDGFAGELIDPKYFYVAPNPTRGSLVVFKFFLKQSAEVEIRIFTPRGGHVHTKSAMYYPQGWNTATWDASGLANGVYFYVAEAKADRVKEKLAVKKIALVR